MRAHVSEAELRSFGRIEKAPVRRSRLIENLLLYSQVSHLPHETQKVPLTQITQNVSEDPEPGISGKGAEVHAGRLPVVDRYFWQLQQLFQNLFTNALKCSQAAVPPNIDITAIEAREGVEAYHVICVRDNGIGFEQHYAEKIFQMLPACTGKPGPAALAWAHPS